MIQVAERKSKTTYLYLICTRILCRHIWVGRVVDLFTQLSGGGGVYLSNKCKTSNHRCVITRELPSRHEKSYIPSTMTTLRSENFGKSAWFAIDQSLYICDSITMNNHYYIVYYYTLILSYISVISLFVSFISRLATFFHSPITCVESVSTVI